jgi:hypothetical protein
MTQPISDKSHFFKKYKCYNSRIYLNYFDKIKSLQTSIFFHFKVDFEKKTQQTILARQLPEEDRKKDVGGEGRADDVADVDGDELSAVHVDLPRQAHQTYGRHETKNGSLS